MVHGRQLLAGAVRHSPGRRFGSGRFGHGMRMHPNQPQNARLHIELPDEPPQLTPEAARVLLRILLKAADKQKREAERDDPNTNC